MKRISFIVLIILSFTELLLIDFKEKKITLYDRDAIVQLAESYLGAPYKAGGSDPSGFDCSGFVMYVYKKAGYRLPRTTKDQYDSLKPVKKPKKGDLVFFSIDGNHIDHVGLYIGNFKFIHAPSSGKTIEIANLRNDYWKKRYKGSRSYFND